MNDEFELDSLLRRMADSHQAELPSPGLIWWRAQILRKQTEKERIERPLLIIVDDLESEVLALLVVNRMQGVFVSCAVMFVMSLAPKYRFKLL